MALDLLKELTCTLIGHDLEPGEEREDGVLPKFTCKRCGRDVEKF